VDPQQIAGMKQPVLVRQISDQDLGSIQNAITDFNKTGTGALRPSERAIADSKRVSQGTLDHVGDLLDSAGENATLPKALEGQNGVGVLDKLVDDGVLTPQERKAYVSGDALTKDGQGRISKLLLGRFFRDPAQLDTVPPIVRNKLERIAAPLASIEPGQWNLVPRVQDALDLIGDAQAHGSKNLDQFMKQNNLLGPQAYSKDAVDLAKTLQKMPQRELSEAISNYASKHAEELREFEKGPGLFGEPAQPTPPNQLFKESFNQARQRAATRSSAKPLAHELKPGDEVELKNGQTVTVKEFKPDGTIEY
jgi:hypothetical protein